MITTLKIIAALQAVLEKSGLAERVELFNDPDVGKAIEALRDAPGSLAVIVPGADTIQHTLTPGFNFAEYAEISGEITLLITARDLAMQPGGNTDGITLKDAVMELLMWHTLAIPGLLCLPAATEPMVIVYDSGRGREAWKLSLVIRQILSR